MKRCQLTVAISAVLALGSLGTSTAAAQDGSAAEFYEGKTIRMITGSRAGSGGDTYTRLIAEHLGRLIPGNPDIIAQNMPEGGGLAVMNYIYRSADADGTVIGLPRTSTPYEPLILGEQSQAVWGTNIDSFNWLGSPNSFPQVAVSWHTADVQTVEDLYDTPLIVGGTGTTGSSNDAYFLRNLLGFQYELVPGYPGPSAVDLAMESGEIDGRASAGWTGLTTRGAEWLEEGKLNFLYQNATVADPSIPSDIPLLIDFAETDEQRELLELKYGTNAIGFPYVAPPGVPQERVDALREAFDALFSDEQFLAAAESQNLVINPVSWQRMEEIYLSGYNAPQEQWDKIIEYSLPPQ